MVNVTSDTLERKGYSVQEVARLYGLSAGTVRNEIARGKLKVARVGRRLIVERAAIAAWLSSPKGPARIA